MILLNTKFLFLNYKRIWFASSLPKKSIFDLISLRQYKGTAPSGWHERKFTTLFTDLTEDEAALLKKIAKNTAYEIKRAEREGVIATVDSIENFRIFFNDFAPTKGLKRLSRKNIASYKSFTIVTKAELNNQALAMHAYLVDADDGRARLLYSATINRITEHTDLNLIGRANRLLHWKDMLLFKSHGIKIYDWGGIAGEPDNPKTSGIDAFKQHFGGYPVTENHYDDARLTFLKKILSH